MAHLRGGWSTRHVGGFETGAQERSPDTFSEHAVATGMRVGIVGQRGNDRATTLAADVAGALADRAEIAFDPATAEVLNRDGTPISELTDCDLVVSIGGDGTFLYAARHADTTPILGVNLGEVGFLNSVAPSDAVSAVRREVAHFESGEEITTQELPRVVLRGEGWALTPAINEGVILSPQRGRGHAITVTIGIDGERYIKRDADGVLVATPAGSTAYNLSEGGPLLEPGSGTLVVTPMSPTPAARPLVIDQETTVRIRAAGRTTAIALADGAEEQELSLPSTVTVEAGAEPARIAGPGVDLFGALGKLD